MADAIHGSGFLAVYLVGLAVGSTPSRYRSQLVAFHEGLAFLAQVTMFIVLGLLVFPSDLPAVALPGLALALLLVVVIRPAAVWISTAFSNFTARERALLGWAGLRGAVPIVLATFVLSAQVGERETIFNAVFFVVVVSTLVQGTTLEWVAERLELVDPRPAVVAPPLEVDALGSLELVEFNVAGDHAIAGVRRARARSPADRARRGRRARARDDPAAREHGDRGRRPAVRACPAREPPRSGGRVLALAPPRLTCAAQTILKGCP